MILLIPFLLPHALVTTNWRGHISVALVIIHLGLLLGVPAQFPRMMAMNLTEAICYKAFRNSVVPIMECLATTLMDGSKIDWNRRLEPNHHHHLFPYFVTMIVDCFSMEVQQPVNAEAHRLPNQGKCNCRPQSG